MTVRKIEAVGLPPMGKPPANTNGNAFISAIAGRVEAR